MALLNQMKAADFMMKFLRGDMTHITPYPFEAKKPQFDPDSDPRLPKSTPEREGIPSGYLRDFFRAADGGIPGRRCGPGPTRPHSPSGSPGPDATAPRS